MSLYCGEFITHLDLFNAVEAPQWIQNSTSPTVEILPNQTDWSIRFDKQVSYVYVMGINTNCIGHPHLGALNICLRIHARDVHVYTSSHIS